MNMTLEQYILNPMGKNNAVLSASAREIMRKTYSKKFDNILLREHGKIEYYLYKHSKNNTYYVYMKIPSEVVKDFYYDVVMKFSANEDVESGGTNLFKYNVQFYSNDPSFVYTYAHVFYKNNLFIKELAPKMSKEALKKEAKEKNPGNNVGYVKALYFAYLVMENRKLYKKSRFEAEAKELDLAYLISKIQQADEKIRDRQELGEKVKKRKKIEVDKTTFRNISKYMNKDTNTERLQVTTTKKINKINSINKNRLVNKVKKK